MTVFPVCKVYILVIERSKGAVIMEFLVTHVRELDQGLYLGHGNRDSALAISIRIGVSDALLITTYNFLLNENIRIVKSTSLKRKRKRDLKWTFQRPSWLVSLAHSMCRSGLDPIDFKFIILFYLGHGNVPLLSDFLCHASLQCSLK